MHASPTWAMARTAGTDALARLARRLGAGRAGGHGAGPGPHRPLSPPAPTLAPPRADRAAWEGRTAAWTCSRSCSSSAGWSRPRSACGCWSPRSWSSPRTGARPRPPPGSSPSSSSPWSGSSSSSSSATRTCPGPAGSSSAASTGSSPSAPGSSTSTRTTRRRARAGWTTWSGSTRTSAPCPCSWATRPSSRPATWSPCTPWPPTSTPPRSTSTSSSTSSPSTRRPPRSSTPWSGPSSAAPSSGSCWTTSAPGAPPGYRKTLRRLREAGVQWQLMLPVQPLKGRYQRPDLRNHRKLVVVDGPVGWAGSQNLIDRSYNKRANRRRGLQWQDLMVRLRGPAVQELEALFATDWYSETDELLAVENREPPEGARRRPRHPGRPVGAGLRDREQPAAVHQPAVRRAGAGQHHQPVLRARRVAAVRGDRAGVPRRRRRAVRARAGGPVLRPPRAALLLRAAAPGRGADLALPAAVRAARQAHERRRRHRRRRLVSNLDIRSFTLDLELTLLVHGRSFTDQLRQVEDGYREREPRADAWRRGSRRPRWQRVVDNLARLTSALQ